METTQITSIHYMRLIAWLSYFRNGVVLNKTQMQKILYICYGVGLAHDVANPIFTDDRPKAWPFGPVFPVTYKKYVEAFPSQLTQAEKVFFTQNVANLNEIDVIVKKYCHYSSARLSMWSHEKDGPWAATVYSETDGTKWNRPIDLNAIAEYFQGSWDKNL